MLRNIKTYQSEICRLSLINMFGIIWGGDEGRGDGKGCRKRHQYEYNFMYKTLNAFVQKS